MKKFLVSLLLLTGLFLTSCSDDGEVNIVSLNSFGSKFCKNDRVKVFVSAKTSGKDLPTYEWGCDGGTLTNPQGLFENVWQAPMEAGTYEIWVTVKCGDAKETRRSKMVVLDELFYSDFETPYYNEGYSNSKMKLEQDKATGSLKVTSSGEKGILTRNWPSTAGVACPYSMQMKYKPSKFSGSNSVDFKITFSAPENESPVKNLQEMNLTVEPLTGNYALTCNYFDNETLHSEVLVAEEGNNAIFKSGNNWKYVSLSVDEMNKVLVYCDGQKVIESNVLSQFVQSTYPVKGSGFGLSNKAVLLVDDLTVLDNGEICTAAERVR